MFDVSACAMSFGFQVWRSAQVTKDLLLLLQQPGGYLMLQRVKILLVSHEHLPPLSLLPSLPALSKICCFSTLEFRPCWWDSPQTSTLLSVVLLPSPVPHQLLDSLAKFNTLS